jgi:hypothetical protein
LAAACNTCTAQASNHTVHRDDFLAHGTATISARSFLFHPCFTMHDQPSAAVWGIEPKAAALVLGTADQTGKKSKMQV